MNVMMDVGLQFNFPVLFMVMHGCEKACADGARNLNSPHGRGRQTPDTVRENESTRDTAGTPR